MENLGKELYEEYAVISKRYLQKWWHKVPSFLQRTFGNGDHYSQLLKMEQVIVHDTKLFASSKLKASNGLNKGCISEIVVAYKNTRERLLSRSNYLTLLAASFGLISAVTGMSLKLEVTSGLFPSLFTLFLFIPLFLLLVERSKLNEHAALAQELIDILELVKSELDSEPKKEVE
ncbi:hypothetical protein [Vibrio cyclitrophicus]|uniref:hypothetical protein n=1 Tax=Vibrio cyclitrophicus TaxID=47951 RepID=UPI00029A606C|nr:hypothetical protein [Vibrio cyclitrophicus]OEE25525.1 hypothetical protein OAM_02270 [Vibrio cyclitrophicus ZF14]